MQKKRTNYKRDVRARHIRKKMNKLMGWHQCTLSDFEEECSGWLPVGRLSKRRFDLLKTDRRYGCYCVPDCKKAVSMLDELSEYGFASGEAVA